jgi:hypothetical protein
MRRNGALINVDNNRIFETDMGRESCRVYDLENPPFGDVAEGVAKIAGLVSYDLCLASSFGRR